MVFLDIRAHKNKINRDKENNMFVYSKSTKEYVSKPIELQYIYIYIYISIFVSNDSYSDIYRDGGCLAPNGRKIDVGHSFTLKLLQFNHRLWYITHRLWYFTHNFTHRLQYFTHRLWN